MQRFHLLVGAIALTLAAFLGACKGPTRPSAANPPVDPPPVPPTITRLEIVGPSTLAPGESAQYSATARLSDGSTRDVTSEASWRTDNESVPTISATGLATGRDRGEVHLTVTASRLSAVTYVVVVPPGTYRLAGAVSDAGIPVDGARVEVMAGTGRGLVAVTVSGTYRLYGVAGDIDVRVTRDGYQEQKKTLQVTSHQTLDFDLVLSRPRDEVGGTYTLAVNAAAECRDALPEEAKVRTYTAVVRQDGPRLTVTLEGSTFYVSKGEMLNSFSGTVDPSRVTFRLDDFFTYYGQLYLPDVLEELTPTMSLAVSGSAMTTISPTGLSGTLSGSVETVQSVAPGRLERMAACRSAAHQFVFSR